MRRGLIVIAVLLLSLTGAVSAVARQEVAKLVFSRWQTTTLVAPDGRPVGGKWQRWVNEIDPAYRGDVTLDLAWNVDAACYQAAASCSSAHEIWEATDTDGGFQSLRSNLYYELGHVYDHAYLTNGLRARIMRLWGLHWRGSIFDEWWSGEGDATPTDVPGEWFAQSYEFCVMYAHWDASAAWAALWFSGFLPGEPAADSIQQVGAGLPVISRQRRERAIRQQQDVCQIIHAASTARS